ncbi:dethiobiotin synthase [Kocuria sp. M1R5S2]|uniref:dethiobiotin synthase n=1 Tax=Kocuria rhizosphaerae TaxID=3376285 RepID=UPI0037A5C563
MSGAPGLDPAAVAAMPRVVVLTGTDTDVGKTVATAVLASALARLGRSVAVDKPVQTGVLPREAGDAVTVGRIAGRLGTAPGSLAVGEGLRLTPPMAPRPAAALDGVDLPPLEAHAERIAGLARTRDHVLVEGSGGLLVELDATRRTLADLALLLRERVDADSGVVVVVRAALGTLNHTALTLEALAARGLPVLGTVIGSWPCAPGPVERSNREHLAALAAPQLGVLPAGLGALPSPDPAGPRPPVPGEPVRPSAQRDTTAA